MFSQSLKWRLKSPKKEDQENKKRVFELIASTGV